MHLISHISVTPSYFVGKKKSLSALALSALALSALSSVPPVSFNNSLSSVQPATLRFFDCAELMKGTMSPFCKTDPRDISKIVYILLE